MRWPLYPAEVAICLVTLGLIWVSIRRRVPGCRHLPIIVPWLVVKLAFALWLCWLALEAHGDLHPSPANAYVSNLILIAGPASVSAFLAVRLWKRG